MPATIISSAGNAIGGTIKALVGIGQRKKGNKLLNSLQYPTEAVPAEEIENQNIARQQAATGLPSEQYNNAMKNIQRQQLLAIKSSHDRRGGLGSIAGIQQGTNDATMNLDVADAKQKITNQNNLMNVNNRLASWKDKVWQANVKDKYNRDYAYGMGLVGQGNQNLYSGIDQYFAGAGKAASGLTGNGGSSSSGGSGWI